MADVEGLAGFEAVFAAGLAEVLAEVAPVLDERARRLLLGAGARRLGRGGIALVAAASGVSVDTVGRGAGELEVGVVADGRVRAKGAGRRAVERTDPGLWPAWERLVGPGTRGDLMSVLRWTTKSTAHLADALGRGWSPGGGQDGGAGPAGPWLQSAGQCEGVGGQPASRP